MTTSATKQRKLVTGDGGSGCGGIWKILLSFLLESEYFKEDNVNRERGLRMNEYERQRISGKLRHLLSLKHLFYFSALEYISHAIMI